MNRSDRQNRFIYQCKFSCMNLLQSSDDMCCNRDRIHTIIRHGAMASFSLNTDLKTIRTRCTDSSVAYNNRTGRERHTCHNMNHQCRINMRILQNTCLNHVMGSGRNLFCRLEHKFNSSFDLIFMSFQKLSCAKHHRCVHIVTAGMHILCL